MSGEGGPITNGCPVERPFDLLPTRDELRAHADNLRDMLAGGSVDAMNLRLAANALDALSRGEWCLQAPCRMVLVKPFDESWLDHGDGGPAPIAPTLDAAE